MVDTLPASRRAPAVANTGWLTVLPPAQRFAFHGDARARTALLPAWGVEFSEDPCRAHANATRATLWMGPDEYLLLDWAAGAGEAGASTAAFAALESSMAGIAHALVDISHRQFAVAVHGPHAAHILNGACPLDLDLAEFPPGMCTRTVFAKASIVLWRTAPDTFHVEIWRSFAGYVTGVMTEIASEFYSG
jgi:sarcosine oxidase subunit gamma